MNAIFLVSVLGCILLMVVAAGFGLLAWLAYGLGQPYPQMTIPVVLGIISAIFGAASFWWLIALLRAVMA